MPRVDDLVIGRHVAARPVLDDAVLFAALVDPADRPVRDATRGSAKPTSSSASPPSPAGASTSNEIVDVSRRFLDSAFVVRLVPDAQRRRPAEWSTVEHRAVEDHVLGDVATVDRDTSELPSTTRWWSRRSPLTPKPLGADQADAVRVLCGEGASVRVLAAPAGFGKTTTLHAAAPAQRAAGRDVVVLATTHKAVGELQSAGLDAQTTARFLTRVRDEPVRAGTTVIVDEVSQLGTRQAGRAPRHRGPSAGRAALVRR